jgi:hypothetical protein
MKKTNKKVRLPVRMVDGQWESIYSGPLGVRDGSLAELTLFLRDLTDPSLAQALSAKRSVQVFSPGAELRIALTIRTRLPVELTQFLIHPGSMKIGVTETLPASSRFVAVTVGASPLPGTGEERRGVWLTFEGLDAKAIESGPIELPKGVANEPAISLNHAHTVLSEKYEPSRKAHTANIYSRAFYQEANGLWYPLDDLRERELASVERRVISAVWSDVGRQLGLPL